MGVLPKILAIAFIASFMSSGVKNPIIRFVDLEGLLLCIALSLTLLHSWNVSCKCFNERISEVTMPTYFFLSSTSTLTTSVRTATKTALPMFNHIPYSILGLNETTDKFFTCKIVLTCSPMPQSFEQCDF